MWERKRWILMKIVNKKKFIKAISTIVITIILTVIMIFMSIELIQYPEKYLTTWRYQLQQKVNSGDQEAIDYYQETYLNHNITLWDQEEQHEYKRIC